MRFTMIDDVIDEFYEEIVEQEKKLINIRRIKRLLEKDYPKSPDDVMQAINLTFCLSFFDEAIFPGRGTDISFKSEEPNESFISYYSPYINPIRGDGYLIRVCEISNKIENYRDNAIIPLFDEDGKNTRIDRDNVYFPSTKAIMIMSAINAVRHRVQHITEINIFSSQGSYRGPQINACVKYLNNLPSSRRFLNNYPEEIKPSEFDAKLIELLAINQIIDFMTESEICNTIELVGSVPMVKYKKVSGTTLNRVQSN